VAENTEISWADDTFNPWEGCQKVSPACDGCYAEARNARYAPAGTTVAPNWGPGAPRRRTSPSNWAKPLKWEREQALALGSWHTRFDGGLNPGLKPAARFVFCASLADVFDNAVPIQWLADLIGLVAKTPHLTYLFLSKRIGNAIKRIREALALLGLAEMPRNIALGATVVTQEEANRDIPKLLSAKAALNPAFAFVSMEPLLGPMDIRAFMDNCYECGLTCGLRLGERPDIERCTACGEECGPDTAPVFSEGCPLCGGELEPVCPDCAHYMVYQHPMTQCLDWVITGGETDQGQHKARPSHPDWFRSLRDQCASAGVAYQHKQNGVWRPAPEIISASGEGSFHQFDDGVWMQRVGKKAAGRLLDGVTHDGRPAVSQ
jgi:protein gp37